jgi:hypothetical protein
VLAVAKKEDAAELGAGGTSDDFDSGIKGGFGGDELKVAAAAVERAFKGDDEVFVNLLEGVVEELLGGLVDFVFRDPEIVAWGFEEVVAFAEFDDFADERGPISVVHGSTNRKYEIRFHNDAEIWV